MTQKINVTRSSMPPFQEYVEEIQSIWESRWLTNAGEKHQKLAGKLKEMLDTPDILLFCNGHLALEAAFSQFEAGSEVITTPFTYASTTQAIVRANLIPVFCDIDPVYYTMDPQKIETLITEKTVAIAPVHVYGNMCACDEVEAIAKRNHLQVIYDAAHAFGVTMNEKSAGSFGDLTMFSFHATKVFHTIEGGGLCCQDMELANKLRAWKRFGIYSGETAAMIGTNAKMTEFSAAMGLCNLRHLDEQIAKRRAAVMRYREHLSGVSGIVLCPEQDRVVSNYAYMPVRIVPESYGKSRDELVEELEQHNVMARKYFYPLTSEFPAYKDQFDIQDTPIAREVSEQIICLPLYADLTVEDVDKICSYIA